LIVTLSLMILLTVIAVGLLTLSSISLRSTGQSGAMATAKSNARLALMLALGELQKQAGPDTRVTARADVLDEKNPPVLGVWKSWEGTNHVTGGLTAGRPLSPGDYAAKKKARFLAWLVSGSTASTVPDTTASAAKVTLVGTGSVGDGEERTKLQIHLEPSSRRRSSIVKNRYCGQVSPITLTPRSRAYWSISTSPPMFMWTI
jgi:hypothetical protein